MVNPDLVSYTARKHRLTKADVMQQLLAAEQLRGMFEAYPEVRDGLNSYFARLAADQVTEFAASTTEEERLRCSILTGVMLDYPKRLDDMIAAIDGYETEFLRHLEDEQRRQKEQEDEVSWMESTT